LDAGVGYLFYRARRSQLYASDNRYALLDLDTTGSAALFGGAVRAGYKLVFSPKIGLTPLIVLHYSRGTTETEHHDTPSYSYPLETAPRLFSLLVGAEVLLLSERLGLQIGIGGGTLKLNSQGPAEGGPALLLAGRVRHALEGSLAVSLGLGVEVYRLSPLGLSPSGTPEQAAQGFLRVGVEFDASRGGGAS
jgi:hypothetical protein